MTTLKTFRGCLASMILLVAVCTSNAQINCSVNAGVDAEICLQAATVIALNGGVSGVFDLNTVRWSIVEQPAIANVQIINPTSIITQTTALQYPGKYKFRLDATCGFGEAFQEVEYQVNDIPKGELTFPQMLNCLEVGETFTVDKDLSPDEYFVYTFLADGVFELVEEEDNFVVFKLVEKRCYFEDPVNLRYRVVNEAGCTVFKVGMMGGDIAWDIFPRASYSYPKPCIDLVVGCLPENTFEWMLVEIPDSSDSYIVDPFRLKTSVCDLDSGRYIISLNVMGTSCLDGIYLDTVYINNDFEDPLMGDCGTITELEEEIFFCNGGIAESFVLDAQVNVGINEVIQWTQIEGPPVILQNTNTTQLVIIGMESGAHYVFQYVVESLLFDCTIIRDYHIFELPPIDIIPKTITTNCTACSDLPMNACFDKINYSFKYEDVTQQVYSDSILIKARLISFPSEYDLDKSITLYGNQSGLDLQFIFDEQNRSQQKRFDQLNNEAGINLWVCGDLATGNYVFDIELRNGCLNEKFQIVLQFIRAANNTRLNAGTDQFLPCGQNSTTLVGNLIGSQMNPDEEGFWSLVDAPDPTINPIVGLPHSRFLELEGLVPGVYEFKYSFAFNEVINDVCNYEIYADFVKVAVSGVPDAFAELDDQSYCEGENYCIELPFVDVSAQIAQISGNTVSIPQLDFNTNEICFDQLEMGNSYSFEYSINNDCSTHKDTFEIEVVNASLSEAIINTPDSCFFGQFLPTTMDLSAVPPVHGTGRWSHSGFTNVTFDPNEFSPEVKVNFIASLYGEFIWTVSNDLCPNASLDTMIVRGGVLNSQIDLPKLIEDCLTTFPDTFCIESNAPNFGVEVRWEIFFHDAMLQPIILDPNSHKTKIIINEPGDYFFKISYDWEGNCDLPNSDTGIFQFLEIRVSSPGSTAFAGEDINSCLLENQLSATEPTSGEGYWQILSSSPPSLQISDLDINDPNSMITFDQPGQVLLEWAVTSSDPDCGVSSTDQILVNAYGFDFGLSDTTICLGNSVLIEHDPVINADLSISQISGPNMTTVQSINETSLLIDQLEAGQYEMAYYYTSPDSICEISGSFNLTVLENQLQDLDYEFFLCFEELNLVDSFDLDWIPDQYDIISIELFDQPSGSATSFDPIISNDQSYFEYGGFDQPGSYTFNIEVQEGPCIYTTSILIRLFEEIDVENIEEEYFLCAGNELVFNNDNLSGNLYYQWTPEDLVSDPNIPSPTFVGENSATLTLLVSSSPDFQNCFIEKEITVNLLENNFIGLPDDIMYDGCLQDSLTINIEGSSYDSIVWSFNPFFSDVIATGQNVTVPTNGIQTIFVNGVHESGCNSRDSIILIPDFLIPELNDAILLCDPSDVVDLEFVVNQDFDPSQFSVSWTNSQGVELGTDQLLTVDGTMPGLYAANWTYGECSGASFATVSVLFEENQITAQANPPQIFEGQSTQLTVDVDEDCTVVWSPSEGLDDPNIPNPTATPTETSIYTVTVTKENCSVDALVEIEVLPFCTGEDPIPPNMFTPNGDGANDCYRIEGEYQSIELMIYDRWGERVFYTTDVFACWDGTFNGVLCNPDVYAYGIRFVHCDGTSGLDKGNVTLVR